MQFALSLLIAVTAATMIVGAIAMVRSFARGIPEGFEDEKGFWTVESGKTVSNSTTVSGDSMVSR